MELKEALDIVSYKIGLRFGETALGDELFLDEKIHEAILDKAAGSERAIDLKIYMQATHIVSAERTRLFQVKNETFLTETPLTAMSKPPHLDYNIKFSRPLAYLT